LVIELAGGKVTSAQGVGKPSRTSKKISVKPSYFADFLGMVVSASEAEAVLTGLGCKVEKKGEQWAVTPPSFRLDLSIPEDLAEEVARSLGYDRILEAVPQLTSAPTSISADSQAGHLRVLNRAKDILRDQGLQETLGFSFTSKKWLKDLGFESGSRLMNPLSDEYEVLIPSLLPGLIQNAVDNTRKHFGSEPLAIRLFEVRPTFSAPADIHASSEMQTNVTERWKLSFAFSGPRFSQALRAEQGEVDFYDVKAVFDRLLDQMGARGVRVQPMGSFPGAKPLETAHLFHPGKTAEVLAGKDIAGYFGLLHPVYTRDLKLRSPLWIAEIDWESLRKLSRPATESVPFKAWSEYPSIERDFALVVKSDVTADKITQLALRSGKPLAKIAKVFDVYRGSQVQEGMTSVAVRVIFYDESRSLQESEAEAASAQILSTWKKELGAELRG
jgi:phenylalanyl-tRNA synthetase beta chain